MERGMRVWVDVTAPAHVLVFRPLIAALRARGAAVETTSRDFIETQDLLRAHSIDTTVVGRHGGRSRTGKARSMADRIPAMLRWARGRRFDLALAHGSYDLTLSARLLGIRSATTHDYEFASLQHQLGFRAATRVVTPEAIPEDRLRRLGVSGRKLRRYPGLKEEYYLSDFTPDPRALSNLGVDDRRVIVVLRPPSDISLYHRHAPVFASTLTRLGSREDVHAIVLPRTREQRDRVAELGLPSVILPAGTVDAQSLIALADLVVSAGGTMNREAAALGVPAFSTFAGAIGGVDEQLIREGRLAFLRDEADLPLAKRHRSTEPIRRDPNAMLELLVSDRD
jgi:uncharacterized protein